MPAKGGLFITAEPTVGLRYNEGKAPIWRGFVNYFPRGIQEVAQVSAFGANKYAWDNWQFIEDGYTNCTDSLLRHLDREAVKEVIDPESQRLHAGHVAWNAMARLEFLCKERENA